MKKDLTGVLKQLTFQEVDLESQLTRIRKAKATLKGLSNSTGTGRGHFHRSAAVRRKMKLAAKKRWAKIKKSKSKPKETIIG
jgi:hypothetical protein